MGPAYKKKTSFVFCFRQLLNSELKWLFTNFANNVISNKKTALKKQNSFSLLHKIDPWLFNFFVIIKLNFISIFNFEKLKS